MHLARHQWKWIVAPVLLAIVLASIWWLPRTRERRVETVIMTSARKYKVDPALIKAVIWKESRFDPDARGQSGELGLMQLMDPAAMEWAEAERIEGFSHGMVLHPGTNTLAGTWYLAKLLKRYPRADNPLPYALADYNAGRSNVLRWNKGEAATNAVAFIQQIDFPGTRDYILSVMERYKRYQKEFP